MTPSIDKDVQNEPIASPAIINTPEGLHLAYVDSLRALAALYVMMSHIVQTVWANTSNCHGLALLLVAPFRYGHYAVGLFIVLSGFSLMLPVVRNDGALKGGALKFFYKRAKRILPPYYFALALSYILGVTILSQKTGRLWDVTIPITKHDVLWHVLMLQDMLCSLKINYVLWSISVEWRIYFLFPLLVLLFKNKGSLGTVTVMTILSIAAYFAVRNTLIAGAMPAYFALFSLGMLAAQIAFSKDAEFAKLRHKIPWAIIAILNFVVFLGLLHVFRYNLTLTAGFAIDMINGFFAFFMLVCVSIEKNLVSKFLAWKPLAYVGTYAYSVYLLHSPLIQIEWQYLPGALTAHPIACYAVMVFLGAPVAVGATYLFHLAFERPFMNQKRAVAPSVPAQE